MNYRQPFSGEWPITQYYGETVTSSFHTGIDYGCPIGTVIRASADGIIRYSGFDQSGYGLCVIIEHDVKHATLYAHMSRLQFYKSGEKVKQGDVIGYSGSTGNSTGPHLHFEARSIWNDYRSHFDPMKLPLISVDDSINSKPVEVSQKPVNLIQANQLKKGSVKVVAPAGVYGHNVDFTSKRVLPFGTNLIFTGNTISQNGLTFCECIQTYWIAVHDGETQLLLND